MVTPIYSPMRAAAFKLQQQSRAAVMETIQSTKPEIFALLPLLKICRPLIHNIQSTFGLKRDLFKL